MTSRREFLKAAVACAVTVVPTGAHGFASGTGLPNPVFAYEFGDITPAQQANFARDFGFAGTVFDHPVNIAERLHAIDEARMQLFFLWFTVDISGGQSSTNPEWKPQSRRCRAVGLECG